MNDKEQIINSYNKSAIALADKYDDLGNMADGIDLAFSYFKNNNLKVLELGCGNGRDAKEIFKLSQNYLGIDFSQEMIKLAKQNVPEADFQIADLEKFNFPNNLDIIFSFASLLHSNQERIKDVLDRAHKALNVGGIFFASFKLGDYKKIIKEDKYGTRANYLYTPELIKELAGDSYKEIKVDKYTLRGQNWFIIVLQKF